MKTTKTIRERIAKLPIGEPISTAAFLEIGNRAAVDLALFRLEKAGTIERVARGIYVRPKLNRFVGKVAPSPHQIAQAIASKTNSVVGVSGAEAARQLGLSTQVPAQPVFFTTGPNRVFHVGKTIVRMKHVASRKLLLAGRPAGVAISALWHLGKRAMSPGLIELVRSRLSSAEFRILQGEIRNMPGWMAKGFISYSTRGNA